MPIGTYEWRAGVGSYSFRRSSPKAFLRVSLFALLANASRCFAYLYLIIAVSLITLPVSVLATSLFAHFSPSSVPSSWQQNLVNLQCQRSNFVSITSYFIATIYFLFFFSRDFIRINGIALTTCTKIRKKYTIFLQHTVYALLISSYLGLLIQQKISL